MLFLQVAITCSLPKRNKKAMLSQGEPRDAAGHFNIGIAWFSLL